MSQAAIVKSAMDKIIPYLKDDDVVRRNIVELILSNIYLKGGIAAFKEINKQREESRT